MPKVAYFDRMLGYAHSYNMHASSKKEHLTEIPFLGESRESLAKKTHWIFRPLRLFHGSFHELMSPPNNQIAFLHGLRTIAILLVMVHHLSAAFSEAHGANRFANLPFVLNGWAGVDLFFVLSGFFIGSQLFKELTKTGTISIKRFVIRRGLRIWPLFFATYFLVLLIDPAGAALKHYGWADLVFLANYVNYGIVAGGWSLCTEEQFYILAPLVLLISYGGARLRSTSLYLWVALALPLIFRCVVWARYAPDMMAHSPDLFQSIYYKFHTHCDGLIMGLILAHRWTMSGKSRMTRRFSSMLVIGALILFVVLRSLQHELLIFTGLALLFGALVWLGLTPGISFFNSRIFYWISRLSFGMYLNHAYLIPFILSRPIFHLFFFDSSIAAQLTETLSLVLLSAGLSLFSFSVIEQPFLNLRFYLLDRR
jgi:peptidoglycan/LPS O-acetylase OafA/YrhL